MGNLGLKVMVATEKVLSELAPVLFQQAGACLVGFGEIPAPDCLKEEE